MSSERGLMSDLTSLGVAVSSGRERWHDAELTSLGAVRLGLGGAVGSERGAVGLRHGAAWCGAAWLSMAW